MTDLLLNNGDSDPGLVEKSARPRSVQQAPPYISRAPFYIQNPTMFTMDQWRQVAKEPVTRLCIRHIIREISALELDIISEKPDEDEGTLKYFNQILEDADDGDGLDSFLSRVLQDAMELPIGGCVEIAPDDLTGMAGGLYHVDGATVYPTYDRNIPFVQINPYDTAQRVYFRRGQIERLMIMPRVDLRRRPFQESPVESAFMSIEAMSRMYIYYMKQLGDTPMAGILDLMDMTEKEAGDWAIQFREMYEGIDPLKIPILYDHVKPAKFIQLARNPQDLNIMENFRRFAELIASAFGLSIGDLRLFEHDRVLAGVEASQRVTARQGVGFYAQIIENFLNRNVLMSARSGIRAKFKLGMTGESQAEAQLASQRAQILMTLSGNQPILKQIDAQKQATQWKIIDIPLTGLPAPVSPGGGAPGGGAPEMNVGENLASMDQDMQQTDRLHDQNSNVDALSQQTLQGLPGPAGGGVPYGQGQIQQSQAASIRKANAAGEKEGHPFRGNQYTEGQRNPESDKPGKKGKKKMGVVPKGSAVDLPDGGKGVALGLTATSKPHAVWLPKWWSKALNQDVSAVRDEENNIWNIVLHASELPSDDVLYGLKKLSTMKEGTPIQTSVGAGVYTGDKRFDLESADKLAKFMTVDTEEQHVVHQIKGVYLIVKLGVAKIKAEAKPKGAYAWGSADIAYANKAVEAHELDKAAKKNQYVHYQGHVYLVDESIASLKSTKVFSNEKNAAQEAANLSAKMGDKVSYYPVVTSSGTRYVMAKVVATAEDAAAGKQLPTPYQAPAPVVNAPAETQTIDVTETHEYGEGKPKHVATEYSMKKDGIKPQAGDLLQGDSGVVYEIAHNPANSSETMAMLSKKSEWATSMAAHLKEQTGMAHMPLYLPNTGFYTVVSIHEPVTTTTQKVIAAPEKKVPYPHIAAMMAEIESKKPPEKPFTVTSIKEAPQLGDHVVLPDGAVLEAIKFKSSGQGLDAEGMKMAYWNEGPAFTKANSLTTETGVQHMPFEAPGPKGISGAPEKWWFVGKLVKPGLNTPATPSEILPPPPPGISIGTPSSTDYIASKTKKKLGISSMEVKPVIMPAPDALLMPDRPVLDAWENNTADFPTDFSQLKFIKGLQGTTGPKLYQGADGQKYVVKAGKNAAHARAEELANAVYRAAGLRVPDSKLYETEDGPMAVHRYMEGKILSELSGKERDNALKELGKGFAADALLANWDVVGMGNSNILVDADGEVWRIDNGGSFDFRAQGDKEGKVFDESLEALWSMREKQAEAKAAYAHLSWSDISGQLQDLAANADSIMASIPDSSSYYKETMSERVGMVKHVAEMSQPMLHDSFKEDYVEQMSHATVRFKSVGLADALPGQLQPPGGPNEHGNYSDSGWVDEHGKKWDKLRGSGGDDNVMKRFLDWVDNPGDGSNPGSSKLLKDWFSSQAGSTWSSIASGMQYEIYSHMDTKDPKEFYWGSSGVQAAKKEHESLLKQYGAEKVRRSMEMYHAFNYNLMSRIDFPNKDNAAHTVKVYRHEATHVLPNYGIPANSNKQLDGIKYPRGPYSSTSIAHPAMSGHLTIQHVPWYRIVGAYFHSKDGESNSCAFYNDSENELLAILHETKSTFFNKH